MCAIRTDAFRILFAVIVAALSVLVGYIYFDNPWLFKSILPFQVSAFKEPLNANKCTYLDKGLFGCEGISIVGDRAYITCSHKQSRHRWFPPLFNHNEKEKIEKDNIYVYDFKTRELEKLFLDKSGKIVAYHGIATTLRADGSIRIGLINVQKAGVCIDILEHRDLNSTDLVLIESICDKKIDGASSIAFLNDGSDAFIVSTYYSSHFDPKLLRTMKSFFIRDANLYIKRKNANFELLKDGFKCVTSISIAGSTLYVTEGLNGRVHVFKIDDSQKILPQANPIFLSQGIERSTTFGDDLVVIGSARAYDAFSWFFTEFKHNVVSVISIIEKDTSDARYYGSQFMNRPLVVDFYMSKINMGTAVAIHSGKNKILVGGIMMQGVVSCEIPENKSQENKFIET